MQFIQLLIQSFILTLTSAVFVVRARAALLAFDRRFRKLAAVVNISDERAVVGIVVDERGVGPDASEASDIREAAL